MSVSFGFYNSVNGDRVYDAIDMGRIFDGVIRDGVFQNYDDDHHIFGVTAISGNALKFKVDIGRAWFDHTWTLNDAPLTLTLSRAPSTYGRWDAIVLDINIGTRTNDIIVVTGTDVDSNPSKPSMIKTSSRKQYPLAYIYMTANTTRATDCTIQNAVGTSACPFVTAPLDAMNIDALLSEWRTEWGVARARIEQQYGAQLATLIDTYLQDESSPLYELIVNQNAQLVETVAQHGEFLGHLTENFRKVFFYQEYAYGEDPLGYYYGVLATTIGESATITSLRSTGGMANAFRPNDVTVIVGDILLSSSGRIGYITGVTRHQDTDRLISITVTTVGDIYGDSHYKVGLLYYIEHAGGNPEDGWDYEGVLSRSISGNATIFARNTSEGGMSGAWWPVSHWVTVGDAVIGSSGRIGYVTAVERAANDKLLTVTVRTIGDLSTIARDLETWKSGAVPAFVVHLYVDPTLGNDEYTTVESFDDIEDAYSKGRAIVFRLDPTGDSRIPATGNNLSETYDIGNIHAISDADGLSTIRGTYLDEDRRGTSDVTDWYWLQIYAEIHAENRTSQGVLIWRVRVFVDSVLGSGPFANTIHGLGA